VHTGAGSGLGAVAGGSLMVRGAWWCVVHGGAGGAYINN
jgi:hypothetical protein